MFAIIAENTKFKTETKVQEIIAHRKNFIESEGLEDEGHSGWDSLDTEETTYLVESHAAHGVMGAARLIAPCRLPSELQGVLPSGRDKPAFVLSDCYFHIPQESELFKLSDNVLMRHFSHLLGQFYANLMVTLESQAIQAQVPTVYAFLNEDDFIFLGRYGGRAVNYCSQFSQGDQAQDLIFCSIDMADLIR